MKRTDDGFTIIELMIAMLIMGIITVPLVSAFVLGLTSTGRGAQDTTNSADAQLMASFFEPDVNNAESVSTTSSCGAGDNAVLQFSWVDGADAVSVSYWTYADTTDGGTAVQRLERHECHNGSETSKQVLARSLAATPAPTCDATTCSATPTRPRRVSLITTEVGRTASDLTFDIRLTATRKVTP